MERGHYSYRVWTAATDESNEYRVGQDVFVRLGRDKSTGRAVVVRERILDPHHPYHGRIQVGGAQFHLIAFPMIGVGCGLYGCFLGEGRAGASLSGAFRL